MGPSICIGDLNINVQVAIGESVIVYDDVA